MKTENKIKSMQDNFCYRSDFRYTHSNPYHDRLAVFDDFVLRDENAEKYQNKWREDVFKTHSSKTLQVEIGTGYGEFMLEHCQKNPDILFAGLDHRFKRSFQVAKKLDQLQEKNFRYLRARGERIEFIFGENEVDDLFYFFPDPWPKTRHHKKRLFQQPFLDAAHRILKNGGTLWLKTDHDGYFEWMLQQVASDSRFLTQLSTKNLREEHPEHFLSSFTTKFEKIFLTKNIKIKALVLQNQKN